MHFLHKERLQIKSRLWSHSSRKSRTNTPLNTGRLLIHLTHVHVPNSQILQLRFRQLEYEVIETVWKELHCELTAYLFFWRHTTSQNLNLKIYGPMKCTCSGTTWTEPETKHGATYSAGASLQFSLLPFALLLFIDAWKSLLQVLREIFNLHWLWCKKKCIHPQKSTSLIAQQS